jgi:serine/threonine protein kinase
MSIQETFEHWQRHACLDRRLRPCNQCDESLSYIVLEDLDQERTDRLLSSKYTTGSRILKIQDIYAHKRYIVKLLLDYSYNTECRNHQEISKLAHGKLPNIMELAECVSFEFPHETRALYALKMEEGVTCSELYKLLHQIPEFKEMRADFWLSQAFQLLYAIAFLHYNCFQHRDLHIRNFVYVQTMQAPDTSIYKVEDFYFKIPTKYLGYVAVPKLIDFGLTANMCDNDEALSTTAYMIWNRPPEYIFCDRYQPTQITNKAELFAYGLCMLSGAYRRLQIPPHPNVDRLVKMIQTLKDDRLESNFKTMYHGYSAEQIAEQALNLVLLLGFPPKASNFYNSPIGTFLFEKRFWLIEDPQYDTILHLRTDTQYGKLNMILKAVLKWNSHERPESARALLLSPVFDCFRTTETSNAWNAFI